MTRSTRAVTKRLVAVVAAFCMVTAWAVAGAPGASASIGGTADATGVDATVGPVTIPVLDIELIPALTTTVVNVGTPPSDATGNGLVTDDAAGIDLAGVTTGLISATNVRTPSGLASTAEVDGLDIDLELGDIVVSDLVTASAVTSASVCPVPGLAGPTADAIVADLAVAGVPVAVGAVDIPVEIDLGIPGVASATIFVDVTQLEAATDTTADAEGLSVFADILVSGPGGVPLLNAVVLDLVLAESSCTQPTAMVPSALSLTPDNGPVGTEVTIDGVGFIPGGTTVNFGELAVTPDTVEADGTSLTFTVPAEAPVGPTAVSVTTPGGTSEDLTFTVTELPVVLAIDPDAGPRGTIVTITGDAFVPGATAVQFGDTLIPADDVTVSIDGTTLDFAVPADAPFGPADVSVVTPVGESGELTFTVLDTPTITALDPDEGPELTLVTVTGSDFDPGDTVVLFGDITIPAELVDVTSPTTLTFLVPDDAPLGPTPVSVATSAGVSDELTFTVSPAAPAADGLAPTSGPAGTVVTVSGDNFIPGATNVVFGDITIPTGDVAVAGDGNSLTFVVPDGAPLGLTDVVVITAGGVSDPLAFDVTRPAPTVDSINPDRGPVGTTVTIIGTGFVPGETSVVIGDIVIPPSEVAVSGDGTTITFVVPNGTPLGEHQVAVITDGGASNPVTFTVTDGSGGGGGGGQGGGGGAATGVTPSGSLPYTGDSASTFVAAGLLLAMAGLTLVVTAHLARRRPAGVAARLVSWWRL